jgi:hypothetical protein
MAAHAPRMSAILIRSLQTSCGTQQFILTQAPSNATNRGSARSCRRCRKAIDGRLEIEAAWRAEFKRIGEIQHRDALNSGVGIADESKRQAGSVTVIVHDFFCK